MSRPAIVLDCDPGIDDAFAIFCALRFSELVAVTTVSGNVDIDNTTRNARHLLELAGAGHVPVHRGAARPLVVAAAFADDVHGHHGLGYLDVPEASTPETDRSASEALVDLARERSLTIVATGPLTNVAMALRLDPAMANSVERVYWMGGTTGGGNVRPRAEFNSWADPHAVDECFGAGLPITMFGLNLTRQVRMGSTHRQLLTATATPTAHCAAELLAYYEAHGVQDGLGQPMHDPCALLGLTHPRLFSFEPAHMVVETDGENRGRTSVSAIARSSTTPVTLAVSAAADAVIELIIAAAENPRDQ